MNNLEYEQMIGREQTVISRLNKKLGKSNNHPEDKINKKPDNKLIIPKPEMCFLSSSKGHRSFAYVHLAQLLEAAELAGIDYAIDGESRNSEPKRSLSNLGSFSNLEMHKLADEFINRYEHRGDAGDYTPNDEERLLIFDCITGFIDYITDLGRISLSLANPAPPQAAAIPEATAKQIWAHGYDRGHNDGIGCGHDLAPRCRHDSGKEADDFLDEIQQMLSESPKPGG